MTLPYTILRKQKQSDKNIFFFVISWPWAFLYPYIYIIWLCPVAMGGVSLLLSKADKPSNFCFGFHPLPSQRCYYYNYLPSFITGFSLCSESSPPAYKHFLASPVLLPFFPALIHSTNSWVVHRHLAPYFTFSSCSNWALPRSFPFDFYVAKSNS